MIHPSGTRIIGLLIALAVGCGTPSNASAQTPELGISDARVEEGSAGLSTLTFHVSLSPPSPGIVSVNYVAIDGSARFADGDYIPAVGIITFGALEDDARIDVTVLGDTRLEANETMRILLSTPQGATLADSEAIGTIENDERTTFRLHEAGFTPYLAGTLSPAWGDPDGDGWLDLPLYKGHPSAAFSEMPGFRNHLADGNYHGGAWCDYDRNGRLDLVILPYEWEGGVTSTLLLRNDGNETFTDVTASALGAVVQGFGETPTWADFDGDGWPDLFCPYYSHVAPFQSFLYRNNGDGTFQERSVAAGVDMPGIAAELRPEGAHAADWNGDGAIDLYCASHFFINDGAGNFTDVREAVGLPITFDEGSSFADVDNDGDLDLYVRAPESPRLFRTDGAFFTEVTESAGLEAMSFYWGDNWVDVDNDGDLDLILFTLGAPAQLLLNNGEGVLVRDLSFEELNLQSALTAWADVDHDGDLDFVVGAFDKVLYLNNLVETYPDDADLRLRVRVLDDLGCESVHGSTVKLHALDDSSHPIQTRVVDGGSAYLSQNEYTVQFGGLTNGRFALEVIYPSTAAGPVVVDSLTNPLLGPFSVATLAGRQVTIYRDGRVEFPSQVVSVSDGPAAAPASLLGRPFPSPAWTQVAFVCEGSVAASAELTIHDVLGRRVKSIELKTSPGGNHTVLWDLTDERGAQVPDGVYFSRLSLDGRPAGQRRVVVMR